MRNAWKHRAWLGGIFSSIAVVLSTVFFNCQRLVQEPQSFAEAGAVALPPSTLRHHPKLERQKVEILASTLVSENGATIDSLPDVTGNFIAKSTDGGDVLIPEGRRLFALVDNECLHQRRKSRASGQMKGTPEALSETASAAAANDLSVKPIDELKLQAYSFSVSSSTPLNQLVTQAESDECVVRVMNDDEVQILPEIQKVVGTGSFDHSGAAQAQSEQTASVQSLTDDAHFASQKHLNAILAPSGWNLFFSASSGITSSVTVAVVDTGVDHKHADLSANMWRDESGNAGRDFVNNDLDPDDDNGHGTHVAGLIGAVGNNRIGVTGVMYKNIKLMAVKIANAEGRATPSAISNGIRWAADSGAELLNFSLGFTGVSAAMLDAAEYATDKGVVVLVAAANENKELNSRFVVTPASQSASIPGMLTVGATDSATGSKSVFSNYSSQLVQLSAPGSNGILSTYPKSKGNYAELEGTSMATPIVTGAAALAIGFMKSHGVSYSNSDVISLLLSSARKNPQLETYFSNGNMLDLDRMARYLRSKVLVEGDGGTEAL